MDGEPFVTTYPSRGDLERAVELLDAAGERYGRIDPSPALGLVAVPALVLDRDSRARLQEASAAAGVRFAGWVEYRPASAEMPEGPEPEPGGCFERASITVLQPCVADDTRIRFIARVQGDLAPVLPYLNAVMKTASFVPSADTLTYMEGHRMVVLHADRITIAKADEIVDAWSCLEKIRRLAVDAWSRRSSIDPCYETRRKPPALEIFKRLPGTNCCLCGEMTCMAFAMRLWSGEVRLRQCGPAFLPENGPLRAALLEICSGLGIQDGGPEEAEVESLIGEQQ